MRLVTALVMAGLLAGVNEAAAQTDESRFFLSVSGAFETGSQTYADDGTFSLYDEVGRLSVGSDDISSGAVLDFGVGVRVMGNFTLGANFHRTTGLGEASVTGQAPHPIFFNRSRSFSATVPDMKRTEQALHLSLGYRLALGDKLDVQIYGGPSQFRFTQDVVNSVVISEAGSSFTTVNVTNQSTTRKANSWGGHVGADVSYPVYRSGTTSFRLGGYVRYAEASSEFLVVSNTVSTKVGGVQFGGGLRVRF
jgi:hypothetical protein